MKINCKKCNLTKSSSCFTPDKRTTTGYYPWCRDCKHAYQRDWRRKNMNAKRKKAKAESDKKNYKKHHADIREKQRNSRLVIRYGITVEDYEEMLVQQGGVCAMCKNPPNGPKRMHVDHCHVTGKVRGILCGVCNKKLGVLENQDWVKRAFDYLGIEYEH